MKKKLDAVYERVQELKERGMRQMLTGGNPLQTILPYELKPVIEEFPILENEFKRRAFYYSALARNQEYLDFIAALHKQIEEIQSLINPAKLPNEPRLKRPRYTPAEDKEDGKDRFWQDMKGIHADLSDPKKWWYLGSDNFENGMPFGVGDSLFVTWKPVVEQYGTVTALMQHAFESGAMEQTEKNIAVYQTFKDDIQKLKEIFEKPLHQLHISDFEHLAHCMLQPEWMGNEERDIQRTKGYVDRVYKDLMLFLDELEESSVMEAPPVTKVMKKKGNKVIDVNGLDINMENQKVSHPTLGSAIFKTGFIPWRILRICSQEEPDGLGKASLDTLDIAESDIYKKLGLINKHFKAPVAHFKNGMVHLDPDFKS